VCFQIPRIKVGVQLPEHGVPGHVVPVQHRVFVPEPRVVPAVKEYTPRKGIFLAGACTGAKTVPETVAEARSAALSIHNYLKNLQ
jgi:thioredoxin reductase